MTKISTYTSLQAAGIPTSSQFAADILYAVTDQSAVVGVFSGLESITGMLQEAADGRMTWTASTSQPGDYPVRFVMEGDSTTGNSVVMTLIPHTQVITGAAPPVGFTGDDGAAYNQVATVEFTVRIAGGLAYFAAFRVGVAQAIDPASYPAVDWTATLAPVLDALVAVIDGLYRSPGSTSGAQARALDAVDVIAVPVNIALLVLKVVSAVKTVIEHSSALQLMICNFGAVAVTIADIYVDDAGAVDAADTAGHSPSGTNRHTLAPPIALRAADGTEYALAQFLCSWQVSASTLQGTGVAWTLGPDDGPVAAALVNVPWGSDNDLNMQADYTGDVASYWDAQHRQLSALPATAGLGPQLRASLNIDALSGKQPGPDGHLAYFYRALMVLQPA